MVRRAGEIREIERRRERLDRYMYIEWSRDWLGGARQLATVRRSPSP